LWEIVERLRIAKDATRERIPPPQDRLVAPDDPHLTVRRARKDLAAVDHAAARGHARGHALAPLPIAVGLGGAVRRVGLERRRLLLHVHPGSDALDQPRARQLGEAEELAHATLDHNLVADGRHVAADQVVEAAHEDEDAVGAVGIGVGGCGGVLDEEAVLRLTGGCAAERALAGHALDLHRLADERRGLGRAITPSGTEPCTEPMGIGLCAAAG
jgi:hypothetical protein